MTSRGPAGFLLEAAGRSLFPIAALVVIAGTMVWGPIVSLFLAYALWRTAGRIA